ncbi:cAMP-regulated phosphoprotein 19-like [Camelus dromedarius]|uniref:cAMP-regulated phosphoprotein 19-like n=1 Tax=Camelus dromedarius TaxID=9838 RepID=UPI003119C88D
MSAEVPEGASAEEQKEMEDKVTSPEKAEEAKLKARYPHLGQKPGGSDFLRKRLQKGQKYFDSGDYNMAKAKMKNKQLPTAAPDKTEVTGDHIPTPQDLPQQKPSLVTSKLAGWLIKRAELHESSNSCYFSLLCYFSAFYFLSFTKSFETDGFAGSGSVCCYCKVIHMCRVFY